MTLVPWDSARAHMAHIVLAFTTLVGCGSGTEMGSGGGSGSGSAAGSGGAGPSETRSGLAVLGWESHAMDSVLLTEIGKRADGLRAPRDLAFNPEHPGELWVLSRTTNSTVTYFDVGTDAQRSEHRTDFGAAHFMDQPAGIAFGSPMRFATCGESRNGGNDFMGPTLWSADMSVYAIANPIDLGSHLDMLHHSPLCMGIAWQEDNVYWAFNGKAGSVDRYDFQVDHGAGYDDHSDGIIRHYVTGEVKRVEFVPSHLEYDAASKLLYIADTGNSRIAVLDTMTGTTPGTTMPANEAGVRRTRVDGAMLTTLVDATSGELGWPSGLALHDGMIFVSDTYNSRISAFKLEDGSHVDHLDTGLEMGSLAGITFDPEGRLYLVDMKGNRVLRIAPKTE